MEDLRADVARIQQYATDLNELMAELQRAAPERSEGNDRSGMVRVRIGHDAIPEAFAVSAQWRDRLPAASFAGAVVEAVQDAAQRRGREWSQVLERSGWPERLRRLGAPADRPASAAVTPANPVPAAFRRPARGLRTPPMDELAEQVMRKIDDLSSPEAAARAEPRPGRGANLGRTVELTLSGGGQVNCQADPRWVESQIGAGLTDALNAALQAARGDLAAAEAVRTQGAGQSDELMTDILSAFDQLVHQTQA
jgi:hypothetical protein